MENRHRIMRNGRSCYLLPRQVADASPPLSYPSFFLLLFHSHSSRFLLGSCSVPTRFLLGSNTCLYRDYTETIPRYYEQVRIGSGYSPIGSGHVCPCTCGCIVHVCARSRAMLRTLLGNVRAARGRDMQRTPAPDACA